MNNYFVYIGTYTNEDSKSQGIYVFRFEQSKGSLFVLNLTGYSMSLISLIS
jgi:6-phosphogluconolactonase (cycloisomerase 2 family)